MFKQKVVCCTCFLLSVFCSSLANASEEYKISSRDTLGKISAKYYKKSKLSRYQLYVGLLAKNPHAFSLGNINKLKRNEVMIIPDLKDLRVMPEKDAVLLVNKHELHASRGNKTQLEAPFKEDDEALKKSMKAATEKQNEVNKKLKELNQQTAQLKKRLNEIEKENEAKDNEIKKLDRLLGK